MNQRLDRSRLTDALREVLEGTDDAQLRAAVLEECYYAVRDNYKQGEGEGEGLDGMDGPERASLSTVGDVVLTHTGYFGGEISLGNPADHEFQRRQH